MIVWHYPFLLTTCSISACVGVVDGCVFIGWGVVGCFWVPPEISLYAPSSVRISTIPAFGTIMETVTQREVMISAQAFKTRHFCPFPSFPVIVLYWFMWGPYSAIVFFFSFQLLERVKMQLASFLEDPVYQDQHSLHMEIIKTFGRVGPNAEPRFRDECKCEATFLFFFFAAASLLYRDLHQH